MPYMKTSHSPRGGCGLKSIALMVLLLGIKVTLREEGVD